MSLNRYFLILSLFSFFITFRAPKVACVDLGDKRDFYRMNFAHGFVFLGKEVECEPRNTNFTWDNNPRAACVSRTHRW